MTETKTNILQQALIFSRLPELELAELAGLSIERRFTTGETVFWEGEPGAWFYVIREGRIKVVKHSSSGKDFIVAFFGPGEIIGEVAAFEGKPYPASAETVNPTILLGFKREDFLQFLTKHPLVALSIINVLSGRLREAQDRLRDFAGERVEQRLARILMMLSLKLGNTLPFTRQEIADMAGTTTETAIRILSRLKEGGIIDSVRGSISILDETKLRLLAEGPPKF